MGTFPDGGFHLAEFGFLHGPALGSAEGPGTFEGERVTFLHAGVERGGARAAELLAKAEAASHASGVPCSSSRATRGSPGTAIAEAARSHGCDLIVVAQPAPPAVPAAMAPLPDGLFGVGLPVLWSSPTAGPGAHAIGVLRDEHRSLGAVLHAWIDALASARAADRAADPAAMRPFVRYLQLFADELHHPKEARYLFRRLRMRTDRVSAELDELERQHMRDRELLADLARLVDGLAVAGTVEATRELEAGVQRYAAFQWEHMGREEGVVLPAAQRHLTPADWSAVDAGFAGVRERGGVDERELERLFALIVGTVA